MFHCLSDSAWADGNLADAAVQLGKMVEYRNQIQPNPGLPEHGTPESPCRSFLWKTTNLGRVSEAHVDDLGPRVDEGEEGERVARDALQGGQFYGKQFWLEFWPEKLLDIPF